MSRFDGKVAFITGVARGQGRNHAVALARAGADIIGIDICDQIESVAYPLASKEDLDETVRLVEATGRKIIAKRADVRDFDAVNAAVNEGVAEFGRLDIVIANAGIVGIGSESPPQITFRDIIDVNLTGVHFTVQATKQHLIDSGGGSIAIISSIMGMRGANVGVPGYVESKHGVIGVMRSAAVELAPHMVRANCIHPTSVGTPMIFNETIYGVFRPDLDDPVLDDTVDAFKEYNAMPVPWVEVDDITNAVLFLASDEARYITGATLPVDAGALLQ